MSSKYWKVLKYAVLSAAVGCFALNAAVAAPKFPKKQIQIVVPYAPGGASDTVARIYGKELEKEIGKPVVIVNRTGASGAVGLESVKNSKPDGYTMS